MHYDATREEDFPPEPPEHAYNWPTCPACGRRRMTSCPICQTAGAEFPLAEYAPAAALADESGGVDEVLLMCPTCDEAFAPRYYGRCELCGHQFAVGVEADGKPPELAGRALWVLVGMVVLGCALGLYFWVILRR